MVFLLTLSRSIKECSQDADIVSVGSVHDAKEAAISFRDAAECAEDAWSRGISFKGIRILDGCLDPRSVDPALDQHLLGVMREQKARIWHRSDPKELLGGGRKLSAGSDVFAGLKEFDSYNFSIGVEIQDDAVCNFFALDNRRFCEAHIECVCL
jgi:hypothetical protein